jgi:hypothetical protein
MYLSIKKPTDTKKGGGLTVTRYKIRMRGRNHLSPVCRLDETGLNCSSLCYCDEAVVTGPASDTCKCTSLNTPIKIFMSNLVIIIKAV